MNEVYRNFSVDRNTPVPLYYQIKTFMEENIKNGFLNDGELVPPEEELAIFWNISRSTIRKAFSELVNEGYLDRLKAKGTFITKPKIKGDFIQKLETFNLEMINRGLKPTTKVLSVQVVDDYPEVAQKLRIKPNEKFIELERLRYADEEPVVYVRSFLPAKRFPGLLKADLVNYSLYEVLFHDYQLKSTRATRDIQAISADERLAELLEIKTHDPILYAQTVAYDQNDEPFEYSLASYRSDIYSLAIDLESKN